MNPEPAQNTPETYVIFSRRFSVLLLIAGLFLSLMLSNCRENAHSNFIGTQAHNFSLPSLSGDTVSLEDFRGKEVMVVFWAAWCTPCLMEIPSLIELQKEFQDSSFQIVALNIDEKKQLQIMGSVKEKYGINYPMLKAPLSINQKFGNFQTLPSSFFISKDGIVKGYINGLLTHAELKAQVQKALKNY